MKNAILISNIDFPIAKIVDNFSDKNVKEAICKILKIDVEILQCESASMSGGIYSVKEMAPSVKGLKPIEGLKLNNGNFGLIRVKYIQIAD